MKNRQFYTISKGGKIELSDKPSFKKRKVAKNNFNFAYFNIGYYLLIPILIGVFLGVALDRLLKTKSIFTLIFIILGAVASFYNLFKITKE